MGPDLIQADDGQSGLFHRHRFTEGDGQVLNASPNGRDQGNLIGLVGRTSHQLQAVQSPLQPHSRHLRSSLGLHQFPRSKVLSRVNFFFTLQRTPGNGRAFFGQQEVALGPTDTRLSSSHVGFSLFQVGLHSFPVLA